MKMNRGVIFSLCAALAAMASPALAAVNVQLNLRYTDPANATGGGTWQLLVKSTAGEGVAGIKVNINGSLGVTGVDLPAGQITSTGAAWNNTDDVFRYQLIAAGVTEVVAGSDLAPVPSAGQLTVGNGGNGNVAVDDLFTNGSTASAWNNSSLIASGSWTGARPSIAVTELNVFSGTTAVAGTVGTVVTRGDSVGVDGLRPGDANRDGRVNQLDVSILASNFNGTSKTWDTADFNSTGNVNQLDVSILAGNFNTAAPSPAAVAAVASVPEPSAIMICALMGLVGLGVRAKSNR
ncbi:MAG: hypothetical protein KF847_14545 [Pirellulales bacterium]|nr:hypothetical protein [Pirellulales bacterium]